MLSSLTFTEKKKFLLKGGIPIKLMKLDSSKKKPINITHRKKKALFM